MYIQWVNRVCEHVEEIGKRPMFWGDIIAAHPETIKELPKDIICMTWDYGLAPGDTNVRKLWENGAHQYLCPGVQGWNQTIHLLEQIGAIMDIFSTQNSHLWASFMVQHLDGIA